ncbi:MAG: hypothetical protein ACI9BD_000315 [Candidatus Marinamargulisbacteria bacterium]|jgi:hypothetical protein
MTESTGRFSKKTVSFSEANPTVFFYNPADPIDPILALQLAKKEFQETEYRIKYEAHLFRQVAPEDFLKPPEKSGLSILLEAAGRLATLDKRD